MSEDPLILAAFRKVELQRREARMRIMLNHVALAKEPLDEVGERATVDALKTIQREYYYRIQGGYWKRLWRALINKGTE